MFLNYKQIMWGIMMDDVIYNYVIKQLSEMPMF